MTKKKQLLVVGLSTCFSVAIAVGATLAWMSPIAYFEQSHNPIQGTVEDAYYASGTGTENDPFIITRPRHLYNLAWLQLLGYYNKTGQEDHQFYFELFPKCFLLFQSLILDYLIFEEFH